MHQAIDVEVVKEPLDVEQEESCNMTRLYAGLDSVHHAQNGVRGSVVVVGPKLARGEEVEPHCIKQNPLCDNLLKELSTALQERNRLVCLSDAVVWLPWFQDWNNSGATPGVVTPEDSGIKEGGEVGGGRRVAPFEEFVCYSSGARSRLI